MYGYPKYQCSFSYGLHPDQLELGTVSKTSQGGNIVALHIAIPRAKLFSSTLYYYRIDDQQLGCVNEAIIGTFPVPPGNTPQSGTSHKAMFQVFELVMIFIPLNIYCITIFLINILVLALLHLGCRNYELCDDRISECSIIVDKIAISNGYWSYNSTDAVLKCNDGYTVNGHASIHCQCNGTWNATIRFGSCLQVSTQGIQPFKL